MEKTNHCYLCGSKNIDFLFSGTDQMHRVEGEYYFWQCQKCKVLFLNPQPNAQNLARHYPPDRYYSLRGADGIPGSGNKLFNILYARNSSRLLKILTFPLRSTFRTGKVIEGGKYLDVGCGSGHFLVYMKSYNMDCYGVDCGEFDKEFAHLYSLNIFRGYLQEAQFANDFFDIITLNHTFEHIASPLKTLEELHRILKPGGTLIIGVPQLSSLAYYIFRKYWAELDIPRHLFLYSTKNLQHYAKKFGFTVTKVRYNSNPVSFIMSWIYWRNKRRQSPVYFEDIDWGKFKYGALFFLLLPLCYLCDFFRVGDQVEIFLSK